MLPCPGPNFDCSLHRYAKLYCRSLWCDYDDDDDDDDDDNDNDDDDIGGEKSSAKCVSQSRGGCDMTTTLRGKC